VLFEINPRRTTAMKKQLLFSLLAVLLFGYYNIPDACAVSMRNLPIIPGTKEKPCEESEKGACVENPALRMEVELTGNITDITKRLLLMSKKQGWKMIKVSGAQDARYQSLNSKGFSLLWSIEKIGLDNDKSKQRGFYRIYYWKIHGE
jgi:hypothetical protein